jgi:hypothetical protein
MAEMVKSFTALILSCCMNMTMFLAQAPSAPAQQVPTGISPTVKPFSPPQTSPTRTATSSRSVIVVETAPGRIDDHEVYFWNPIDENLTCPGPILDVSLVREESSAKVYFVCGGKKLWIPSTADFDAAGFDWGKVQVVPDGALNAYQADLFSAPAKIKPSDVFFDCGDAYSNWWGPPAYVGRWHPNCKESRYLVRKDVVVAGWLTAGTIPEVNKVDGVEDVWYNITLDPSFIDKMYGQNGLTGALNGKSYPGHPSESPSPAPTAKPIDFEDLDQNKHSRGVTFNSFILPLNADGGTDPDPCECGGNYIHVELNAWHVQDTNVPTPAFQWVDHFVGRGPAPLGWRRIPFGTDTDVWWPFELTNPDSGPRPLQSGDYVILKGALWEDSHEGSVTSQWGQPPTESHYSLTEVHPMDWIVRVDEPESAYRKTVCNVQRVVEPGDPSQSICVDIKPDFTPAAPTSQYSVGEIQELIDGRGFTDITTFAAGSPAPSAGYFAATNLQTHVAVTGTVSATATKQGRFKASYIVGWREKDSRDVVDPQTGNSWVDEDLPPGAKLRGNMEKWNWVTSPVFSGHKAHQSANQKGRHQHYFIAATNPLTVAAGDTLFACVYLDPAAVPCEVMLQWTDDNVTWEHRAYWGANIIDWGTDGTNSRRFIKPISIVGQWVRLEVPASSVGLEGKTVTGMAFTLHGGRATWDYAGKR